MYLPGTLLNQTGGAIGDMITYIFLGISFLGDQIFYLIMIPVIYWCYKKGFGTELVVMLLTTYYCNLLLKEWFKVPRPSKEGWVPGSKALSYSFPSGHAQGSASFWIFIGEHVRKCWAVIAAIVWVGAVSYSRVFLGVHRWEDLIAGWVFGVLIAGIFMAARGPGKKALEKMTHFQRICLAVAIPLILFLIFRTLVMAQLCGFLLGVMVGAELENNNLNMPDCKNSPQRLKRVLVGFPICGFLLFGLGGINTQDPGWVLMAYTFSGMGVTYFAPLAFSTFEDW